MIIIKKEFFLVMGGKKGSKKRGENGAYPSWGYYTNEPKKWVPQNSLPKVEIVDDFNRREAIRKINQDNFSPSSLKEKRLVTASEYKRILRQHLHECRKIIRLHRKPHEKWSSRLLDKATR